MAEGSNMDEVVKTEVGEDTFVGDQNEAAIYFVV